MLIAATPGDGPITERNWKTRTFDKRWLATGDPGNWEEGKRASTSDVNFWALSLKPAKSQQKMDLSPEWAMLPATSTATKWYLANSQAASKRIWATKAMN